MKSISSQRISVGGNFLLPGQTAPNTIILRQPKRFNIDIADYVASVRSAENVDFPRRYKLYDLYTDILMDTHLSSVIEKRINAVSSADIEFRRNGKVDDGIVQQLRSPWFDRLVRDILESQLWGFSLCQFYKQDGWINYDLIPRKHVDPYRRIILHHQEDITGISWDEYPDLLFIGQKDNLGLLAKAAPWVIYKRNNVADWAQFCEVFGMPLREYVYETDDDMARSRAIQDAQQEGSLATFIHSKDTSLKLVDSENKTGSSELYDKLCETCNAELSKLILGNTLTTEAGKNGTQALGTVHKKEENTLAKNNRKYVLNVLNYDMADILQSMGINMEGGEFFFPEPKEIDQTSKMNILVQLRSTFNLPVSDDYLYEEFGVDKPKDYDRLKEESRTKDNAMQQLKQQNQDVQEEGEDEDEGEDTQSPHNSHKNRKTAQNVLNRIRSFFVHAPRKQGAHLDW